MAHLRRAMASIHRHEQAISVGLGPYGLDQLLTDEANQTTITNCGDVILASIASEDPLGALILKLVVDSCAALGDASKRVLLMVLAGLREYLRTGLHPHTFQYDLAAQVLQCTVPSAVLHVPLPPGGPQPGSTAAQALHALIATHMCGHAGGQAAEQQLGDCLQELVLLQLRAAAAAGISAAEALEALRDSPPLSRLPGAPATQSRLLRGVLLHESPLAGPAPNAGVVLQRPKFLGVACPLDGEAITGAGGGGDDGPAVAVQVGSGSERWVAEEAAAELLRQRVALLAERGVGLLLLCGRPPPLATQYCHEYGICLVAGLDEQDAARACAAGGGAPPLSRAGLTALAAAPLGCAAAARLVGLGPGRRGLLLEFTLEQCVAAGQAAWTLLLRGGSDAAVRQSARALRRCLISLAAAVGTLARSDASGDDGDRGDAEGGHSGAECLVFVAGGGGFEALLELQLRELADVAKRGVPEAQGGEEEQPEDPGGLHEVREREAESAISSAETAAAAAAEARTASELLASLRVLHAMAAAVPRALMGAAGGSGAPVGGSGTVSAAQRRAQREALLQVHALRQCQADALRSEQVVRCGLVVPSAAFSFHGRALRDDGCGEDATAAAAVQGPGDGDDGGAGGRGCERSVTFVRSRPVLGGHGFVAVPDAVSYGVVEAAAVVTSAWNHAVDVIRQVIRIDGAPAAAVSVQRQRGGPVMAVAGPALVEVPRARRGGQQASWSSGESGGSDDRAGSSSDDGS